MLAKRVEEIPVEGDWIFEPKWDGFRALVFRDGDELLIQSRDLKPLDRYFPEVVETLREQLPERCVLDGEVVIAGAGGLEFEALQLRLHPAASRVKLLATEIPASVVFFDLLCVGERDLRGESFEARRAELERMLAGARSPVHITPATRDSSVALDWFRRFEGAGLDGVMAKPATGLYEPNKRSMLKVKHERDCDCVVAGFRWHKDGEGTAIGSLLLGLFDAEGALQHVGVCSSFTQAKRRELVGFLEPYRERALEGHPWRGGRRLTGSGCLVGRAGGVRGRICRGSRCGWSWWWRWRMSICRGDGFGIWRISGGGGRISGRKIVRMLSWRWWLRRS